MHPNFFFHSTCECIMYNKSTIQRNPGWLERMMRAGWLGRTETKQGAAMSRSRNLIGNVWSHSYHGRPAQQRQRKKGSGRKSVLVQALGKESRYCNFIRHDLFCLCFCVPAWLESVMNLESSVWKHFATLGRNCYKVMSMFLISSFLHLSLYILKYIITARKIKYIFQQNLMCWEHMKKRE